MLCELRKVETEVNGRKVLACALGALALTVVAVNATALPTPIVLPTVGDTFAAPYDTVWGATLASLGVVKALVADKSQGRIETDVFPFKVVYANQVIWVSFAITVTGDGPHGTTVRVQPRVHDALLEGIMPGTVDNPWVDLFARIEDRLGHRP